MSGKDMSILIYLSRTRKNIPICQEICGNQFPISRNCVGCLTQFFVKTHSMGTEQFFLYSQSMLWGLLGFPKNFQFPQTPTAWAFHRIFPCYGNLYIPKHWGIPWISTNSKSVRKTRTRKLPVLSHTCSVRQEFTHPMVWELHGFLLLETDVRNSWLLNVCVFLYFSRTMMFSFHIF